MQRMPILLLSAMAAMLVACDADAPPASPGAVPTAAASAMEFRGERPCVDCAGIEAWLRLEQEGATRHYRLVEHYR
ncbi:MAG: hypothetical protein EOP93_03970, partial [Lysobacteraceae bacterium]